MLLKSMVLWMLKHMLLSSVNNICRNTKIGETQNFASLFLFAGYSGVSGTLCYSGGGNCSWFGNYNGFRNTSCSSSTSSSRFYRCFSILVILVINSRGLGFYFNFVVGGCTSRASLRMKKCAGLCQSSSVNVA